MRGWDASALIAFECRQKAAHIFNRQVVPGAPALLLGVSYGVYILFHPHHCG